MNSFRAVERAIEFEIERQAAALDAGEPLVQETRGWSEERGETYRMRVKETSDDYRYFPEPDLPPLHVDPAWLARSGRRPARAARRPAGALPARRSGLSPYDAAVLVADPDATALFEATTAAGRTCRPRPSRTGSPGSTCASATPRPVPARGGRGRVRGPDRGPSHDGSISRASGREVLDAHVETGQSARPIIEARGLRQISDAGRARRGRRCVLAANPAAVADYRAGKAQAVGFLVGQVMKATRGQANAALAGEASAVQTRRGGVRVGAINLVLWVGGVGPHRRGYSRGRGPWRRYQALKEEDANVSPLCRVARRFA